VVLKLDIQQSMQTYWLWFMFIYLQCFSTRLLRAIFSPISVQTGFVRLIFAKSAFVASTLPPVDKDPMFTSRTSFFVNFWTCYKKNSVYNHHEL